MGLILRTFDHNRVPRRTANSAGILIIIFNVWIIVNLGYKHEQRDSSESANQRERWIEGHHTQVFILNLGTGPIYYPE